MPVWRKFVPVYIRERPGESRYITGISGEILQYAQFAAAFGRIVSGKSAANGRRIDSGAAIRKFSCRGQEIFLYSLTHSAVVPNAFDSSP